MQISTRDQDFLIDTLELRKQMQCLNSSFTDPQIVKVLHGSDSDVVWLQKDFGLYLVNMFDTGQACRVLEFPNKSLAYLLKQYCNVSVDKKYQLADWRIRPIPPEMIVYARQDTHYLLYITDCIRNESIIKGNENNNLLVAILSRSRDLCLLTYEKEIFTPTSYMILYNKYNVNFDQTQLKIFASLYEWRDKVARREDESLRYILPNHMLFHIAQEMPHDADALFSCCNPVPPLVRANAYEITGVIREAKLNPNMPKAEIEKENPVGNETPIIYNEAPVSSYSPFVAKKIKKEKEVDIVTPNDSKYQYSRLTQNYQNKEEDYIPSKIESGNKMKVIISNSQISSKKSLFNDKNDEITYSSHETAKSIKNSLDTDMFKPLKIDINLESNNSESNNISNNHDLNNDNDDLQSNPNNHDLNNDNDDSIKIIDDTDIPVPSNPKKRKKTTN